MKARDSVPRQVRVATAVFAFDKLPAR